MFPACAGKMVASSAASTPIGSARSWTTARSREACCPRWRHVWSPRPQGAARRSSRRAELIRSSAFSPASRSAPFSRPPHEGGARPQAPSPAGAPARRRARRIADRGSDRDARGRRHGVRCGIDGAARPRAARPVDDLRHRAAGGEVSKPYAGETCVLAYSGGLDTSVAVAWLRETLGFEVVTCTGDLGATGDLEAVQRKAIASGARKAIVQDARDIFLRYFVWPALQAGALYEDRYPLATALGRPLLAKMLVDAARAENARFVAHGCTGKGNDQVRFDLAVGALAPDL